MAPARWLIAITALSLAAAGLLGVMYLDLRATAESLRRTNAAADRVQAELRARQTESENRIEVLTASVTEARRALRALRSRVPEVVERVRVRRIYVREQAEREISQPPSQEGADASLRRLGAFREQLAERGVRP